MPLLCVQECRPSSGFVEHAEGGVLGCSGQHGCARDVASRLREHGSPATVVDQTTQAPRTSKRGARWCRLVDPSPSRPAFFEDLQVVLPYLMTRTSVGARGPDPTFTATSLRKDDIGMRRFPDESATRLSAEATCPPGAHVSHRSSQ
jgi:hypothetical protein